MAFPRSKQPKGDVAKKVKSDVSKKGKNAVEKKGQGNAEETKSSKKDSVVKMQTEMQKVGSTVLGVVAKIYKEYLLIDLPGVLRQGVVQKNDAAESAGCETPLKERFSVGQFAIAAVIGKNENVKGNQKDLAGRLQLSLRPSMINSSFSWAEPPTKNLLLPFAITDVEEHGLAGMLNNNMKVFVKSSGAVHTPGQIVLISVEGVKKEAKLVVGRLVTREEGISRYISDSSSLDMTQLVAGQLVECRIDSVISSGTETNTAMPAKKRTASEKLLASTDILKLKVNFARALTGHVLPSHLHHPLVKLNFPEGRIGFYPFTKDAAVKNKKSEEWPSPSPRFLPATSCYARVIAVSSGHDSEEANVWLSLLPHHVHLVLDENVLARLCELKTGEKIENCRVVNTCKKTGVRLLVPNGGETEEDLPVGNEDLAKWGFNFKSSVLACCSRNDVAAEALTFAIQSLQSGQKVTGRVLDVSLMDLNAKVALGGEKFDSAVVSVDELKPGQLIKGKITKVLDWGFYVELSAHLHARCNKEHTSDIALSKLPSKYSNGTLIKSRVLSVDPKTRAVFVTMKKGLVEISEEDMAKHQQPSKVELNDIFTLYVSAHTDRAVVLRGFGDFYGHLPFADIAKTHFEVDEVTSSTANRITSNKRYAVGATMKVRVHKISVKESSVRLTFSVDLEAKAAESNLITEAAKPKKLEKNVQDPKKELPFSLDISGDETAEDVAARALEHFPIGEKVEAKIRNISDNSQEIHASVYGSLRVTIHALEVTDDKTDKRPLSNYEVGETITVRIIGKAARPALHPYPILLQGSLRAQDAPVLPAKVADLVVGQKYDGIIQSANRNGVFVYLSSGVTARVKLSEATNKAWEAHKEAGGNFRDYNMLAKCFPVGSRVKNVRVLSVSLSNEQAEATLKSDDVAKLLGRAEGAQVTFESLQEGDKLAATVKRIETFGVFVTLSNSDRLDALCLNSERSDDAEAQNESLSVGDLVLVKVLKKDVQRRRINVGLKSSYFDDVDMERAIEAMSQAEPAEEEESLDTAEPSSDTEEPAAQEDTETVTEELEEDESPRSAKRRLLDIDRDWFSDDVLAAPAAAKEDSVFGKLAKTVKRAKKESAGGLESERELRRQERSTDWAENPTTEDDFEKLLLLQRQDVSVYVSYMAHFVELEDYDKARQIAQRAIDSIDITKREERGKIWLVWLNLEVAFGDETTQGDVLQRALQHYNEEKVYLHMIALYEDRGEFEKLDALASKMMKKVSDSKPCWLRYITSLYVRDRKRAELSGALMPKHKTLSTRSEVDDVVKRCLQRLPKSTHVEVKTTVARLEFKFGSSESGRAAFSSLLESKPGRLDIWNLYFDAHLSSLKTQRTKQEINAARHMFKQAVSTAALKARAMQSVFQRWLEFETLYGDASTKAVCVKAAEEYVQSQTETSTEN